MHPLAIAHYTARGALLIVCAIIIALSVIGLHTWTEVKIECRERAGYPDLCRTLKPILSVLSFGAFAGGFGLVDASVEFVLVVGNIGHWGWIVAFDVLAAMFLVAGGVSLSAELKKQDFDGWCKMSEHWTSRNGSGDCTLIRTDAAFVFLGFIVMVVSGAARLLQDWKKAKSGDTFGMELQLSSI